MPPITAAMNPFEPDDEAHLRVDVADDAAPNSTPPAPASAEPSTNVNDDHAVDVDAHHRGRVPVDGRARIALPMRVRETSTQRDHQRDSRRR